MKKTALSSTVSTLLLRKEELAAQNEVLAAQNEVLEDNIRRMEPLYERYRDTLLFGNSKKERIKIETSKLQRVFAKPTLSLDDISNYTGVDRLTLEEMIETRTFPMKYGYVPTCPDDVVFVSLVNFAEFLVDHSIDRWTEE